MLKFIYREGKRKLIGGIINTLRFFGCSYGRFNKRSHEEMFMPSIHSLQLTKQGIILTNAYVLYYGTAV